MATPQHRYLHIVAGLSAVLFASVAHAGKGHCPVQDNGIFKAFSATEVRWTENAARRASRQRAREQARLQLCPHDADSATCAAREAALLEWSEQTSAAGLRTRVCTVYGVRHELLPNMQSEIGKLEQEIRNFQLAIKRVDPRSVSVERPVWSTGCEVGIGGAAMRARVREAVASAGIQDTQDATPLRLEMAAAGHRIEITAQLGRGRTTVDVIRAASFAAGLDPSEEAACKGHQKQPSAQVGLSLAVQRGRRQFCAGDVLNVRVSVDKPSRIRLYSVNANNEAHLVWPVNEAGHLDQVVSPGRTLTTNFVATATKDSIVRLIAVGVPDRASLGRFAGTAHCRVPGLWSKPRIPTSHVLTLNVLAPRSCPRKRLRRIDDIEQLPRVVREAPPCW